MILIIAGHPASGKSVLRDLVNSHSEIEITDDFFSFLRCDAPYKEYIRGFRKRWYIYPIIGDRKSPKLQMHLRNMIFLARFIGGLQLYRRRTICAEHIEKILQNIFPHASVVGDIGVPYLWHRQVTDKLVRTPNMVVTCVYRDCRDVAGHIVYRNRYRSSWAESPWVNRNMRTLEDVAKKWVWVMEGMEQYSSQIHTIRYEDLVTDPQAVITELSALLPVDPEGFDYQKIHAKEVGTYKQWLSDDEIATILTIAGPTMERLGYTI